METNHKLESLMKASLAPGPYLEGYGITLRQHFAGLAMQGILHGSTWSDVRDGVDFMAEVSVKCADFLLRELAKDPT